MAAKLSDLATGFRTEISWPGVMYTYFIMQMFVSVGVATSRRSALKS
jgi:hypothetical protein